MTYRQYATLPPSLAPSIITGRGYVNLAADGYCGPDGTDMLAGWNQAVLDVQQANRGQAIRITPGDWVTSGTLRIGDGLSRIYIDGHAGQANIRTTTATSPVTFMASQSGTTLTVVGTPPGYLGIGSNIAPPGWNATTPTVKRCTIIKPGPSAGQWITTVSQTVTNGTWTAGNPLMVAGSGTAPGGMICGHIDGIRLAGPTVAPSDLSTGLVIATYTDMDLHHVEVSNTDIGIDFINNTFFTRLSQVTVGSNGVCNIGLHLRGGAEGGAGNQISLNHVISTGTTAGIMVGPNSDGINIWDGQLGCTVDGDDNGVLVLGRHYVTGERGGVGNIMIGAVDMESFKGWAVRAYGSHITTWMGGPVISDGNTGRGIMKTTNGVNERVVLMNLGIRGGYSSAQPIVRDGSANDGKCSYTEISCQTSGANFNGIACRMGLLAQSGINPGTGMYFDPDNGSMIKLGAIYLRENGYKLQASLDRSTWTTLYG